MSTPAPLSAAHIGSFAYLTVKDRLPVILTRVIDHLYRDRIAIGDQNGEGAVEGCKEVVGRLSRLKNEIQTNKALQLLEATEPLSSHDDSAVWNTEFDHYVETNEVPPKWYTAPWLYVECYMYARIHEAFYLCPALKDFDPFMVQKQRSLMASQSAAEALAHHLLSICNSLPSLSQDQLKKHVINLIEVSVWGNRCDLSISGGAEVYQDENFITSLDNLRPNLLVNNSDSLWQLLVSLPEDQQDVVVVLDNAGLELVSDLCLMTLLVEARLTTSITLQPKTRPWFVSDVTTPDLTFTIDTFRARGGACAEVGEKWTRYLETGRWKVEESSFWTTYHSYHDMSQTDPSLYSQLTQASLIILKGDLNYRKLTGDFDWPTTTTFEHALLGFHAAPLVALRTAKGGPVVGLGTGQEERLAATHPDWNIDGSFGMIQLATFS